VLKILFALTFILGMLTGACIVSRQFRSRFFRLLGQILGRLVRWSRTLNLKRY
jgi:hypothetical protein